MIKFLVALFFLTLESGSNIYLPRQISSQNSDGRPRILNVKIRFVLPPLLNSKIGSETHKDLKLVGTRGM